MATEDDTDSADAGSTGTVEHPPADSAPQREAPRFTRKDLDRAVGEAWAQARREHRAQREAAEAAQLVEALALLPEPEQPDPIVDRIRQQATRKNRVMRALAATFAERHLTRGRRR